MDVFKKATWITAPNDTIPAPIFRKEFDITKDVESAICSVSGLGCYMMTFNGVAVNETLLNPRFSHFDKTIYYNSFPIETLTGGKHAITLTLGLSRLISNTKNVWYWDKPVWNTLRKLILQIEVKYKDGTTDYLVSDSSWKVSEGPIRSACLYLGEVYDASYEQSGYDCPDFNDSDWENAKLAPTPHFNLTLQTSPPIIPIREIKPVSITELENGNKLYSFDENIAGNIRVTAKGTKDSVLKIHYGEKLFDDNSVDSEYCNVDGTLQIDTYIFKATESVTYLPYFSYKGYRYVEISADPEVEIQEVTGIVYHNAISETGKFHCSSLLLNTIHSNSKRALLSNLHHVATDTPIYEKNGWTGDAQLTAYMAAYNFDIKQLYEVWMTDFADSQHDNGELPPIIPSPGWGYSTSEDGWERAKHALPAWDAAYFEIINMLYQFYDDSSIIKKHYKNLKKYITFLTSFSKNYIVKAGLGDWLAPVGEDKSEELLQPNEEFLSSTAYFYKMTNILADFALILKQKDDTAFYNNLALDIRTAYNNEYLDRSKNRYSSAPELPFRQTPNIISLAFGLVPDDVADKIAENLEFDVRITRNGHLWTGIIGTRYIAQVLCNYGYVNTAFELVNKKTYPSWGYWIENGATSLYENWELDTRSRNHHMFGSVDSWFYSHLAGIKPIEPGFREISIKPYFPDNLSKISAEVNTPFGSVSVKWDRKSGNHIDISITIPKAISGFFINTTNFNEKTPLVKGINRFTLLELPANELAGFLVDRPTVV